jgi:hypothetical protein
MVSATVSSSYGWTFPLGNEINVGHRRVTIPWSKINPGTGKDNRTGD